MRHFLKLFNAGLILLAATCFGTQVQAAEATNNSKMGEQKSMTSQFCWTELATTNVQAAKDFYSKVFGWKFTEHSVDNMTYTMVNVGGDEFAGIWAIPKDQEKQIPPHWMSYICVENLEQSLEKARKNGATVVKPITQAGDYGRLAIIKDPTGAQVALWQAQKGKVNYSRLKAEACEEIQKLRS